MYDGGSYPGSLSLAEQYLGEDRAWVGCLVHEDGVRVLASAATRTDLESTPATWGFLHPNCPPRERASFLLGGLQQLEADATAA